MRNIKMTIAYDGGSYLGWQKTREGPSIEESLQRVLEQILRQKITLQASSRTDAGVHAYAQTANFECARLKTPLDKLLLSANSLLPTDIVIRNIEEAPADFHPTLSCKGKEYHYWLCFGPCQLPQHRRYSWHIHHPLDLEAMTLAAKALIGEHDFAAFCNVKKNESYENTVREVYKIEFQEHPDLRLQIIISGNRFMYKMVRNLVGTLAYAGMGKLEAAAVPLILSGRDRTRAGPTAPAHGLTLFRVY